MRLLRVEGGPFALATNKEGDVLAPEITGWITEPGCTVRVRSAVVSQRAPVVRKQETIIVRLAGRVTSGVNLAHARFGGTDGDDEAPGVELPIGFEGELRIDESSGVASFTLIGLPEQDDEDSPFGIVLEDVITGVTVTPEEIVIADVFDDVSFSLVINRRTGTGRFSYQETIEVGMRTLTRIAEGLIASTDEEDEGTVGGRTLLAAGLFASRRRHGPASCGRRESE